MGAGVETAGGVVGGGGSCGVAGLTGSAAGGDETTGSGVETTGGVAEGSGACGVVGSSGSAAGGDETTGSGVVEGDGDCDVTGCVGLGVVTGGFSLIRGIGVETDSLSGAGLVEEVEPQATKVLLRNRISKK